MTAKAIDINASSCLVVIFPVALVIALLFTAWPVILGLAVVGGGWRVWQGYQWQQLSQQVNPFFHELIQENRGSVTTLDLAMKANLTGGAAKLFLENKAKEFGAQQQEVEEKGSVYYFITAKTLGGIFDDSEQAIASPATTLAIPDPWGANPDPNSEELAEQSVNKQKYPQALIQSELARRLGVHSSTVLKRRSESYFSDWSRRRDPEKISWRYSPETKLFFPVDSKKTK